MDDKLLQRASNSSRNHHSYLKAISYVFDIDFLLIKLMDDHGCFCMPLIYKNHSSPYPNYIQLITYNVDVLSDPVNQILEWLFDFHTVDQKEIDLILKHRVKIVLKYKDYFNYCECVSDRLWRHEEYIKDEYEYPTGIELLDYIKSFIDNFTLFITIHNCNVININSDILALIGNLYLNSCYHYKG